jgi:uncharacterized protein YegL
LDGEALYAVSRLAEAPLRVETRAKKVAGPNGDVVEQSVRFPIWFEPRSHGKTAMCAGLNAAIGMLEQWRDAHPSAYPPTVLHVTDGHPSDGNPEPIADRLKSLATETAPALCSIPMSTRETANADSGMTSVSSRIASASRCLHVESAPARCGGRGRQGI